MTVQITPSHLLTFTPSLFSCLTLHVPTSLILTEEFRAVAVSPASPSSLSKKFSVDQGAQSHKLARAPPLRHEV